MISVLRAMLFGCLCKLLFGWPFNPVVNPYQPLLTHQQLLAHNQPTINHQLQQLQSQHQAAALWPAQRFGLKLNAPQAAAAAAAATFLAGHPLSEPQLAIPIPFADQMALSGLKIPTEEELYEMEREQLKEKLREKIAQALRRKHAEKLSQEMHQANNDPKERDYHPESTFDDRERDPFDSANRFDDLKPKRTPIDDYDTVRDQKAKLDSNIASGHNRPGEYVPPLSDDKNGQFEPRKSEPLQAATEKPNGSRPVFDRSDLSDLPTKRPVEVKRQTMTSPNGHLTYITEMLYDVQNNPFKPTTNPVTTFGPNFLAPSTTDLFTTDDPRALLSQTAGPYGTYVPPLTSSITYEPLKEPVWSTPASMPTPPTPFKALTSRTSPPPPPPPPPSKKYPRPSSNKNSKLADSSSSIRATLSKKHEDGLGATAIAGIVIGSLVSVALLAGITLKITLKQAAEYKFGR